MSKTSKKISVVGMIIAAIVLCAVRLTGPAVHILCGIMLCGLCIWHICPKVQKMKHVKGIICLIDIVMLACLICVVVSGMLLHPLGSVLWMKIIHKLTGLLFIIGIFIHIAQHRH